MGPQGPPGPPGPREFTGSGSIVGPRGLPGEKGIKVQMRIYFLFCRVIQVRGDRPVPQDQSPRQWPRAPLSGPREKLERRAKRQETQKTLRDRKKEREKNPRSCSRTNNRFSSFL